MYSPEQKVHLYLERRYKQSKQPSRMNSLPTLPMRPQRQPTPTDLLKDSADFLLKINLFAQRPKQLLSHKSQPASMHKAANALVDFNGYRKQLFERLDNRTRCEFKFSFDASQPPVQQSAPKLEKAVTKSYCQPTVPAFLTTLLKSTFHYQRQKNVRKRLHRKPLLHVEEIVSKRKERLLA